MSEESCFGDNSSVTQSNCVSPDSLEVLTDSLRHVFTGVFIVTSLASLIGNCAVIYVIIRKNHRFIQKTCIVSLAASDLLSTIVIATNNLETFSHKLLIWTLGSFLCSFIPMCQMAGILASSIALMFIAMDRYRNVVNALSKRWNPTPLYCLLITGILWVISFAVSYPLYYYFLQEDVILIYVDIGEEVSIREVKAHMCVSFDKNSIKDYYIAMVNIIFLPLILVFLWFYYHIASLVWKHRKPPSAVFNKRETTNLENSSSTCKTIEISDVKTKNKSRDLRVERKIRTFKIIVTLMVVFICCRLPYFAVYILKLTLKNDEYGLWTWVLNYIFTALHIVNCCLNPLLYTFLNQTLTVWIRFKKNVKSFISDTICCFCFSNTDFKEFEKENPFENYDKPNRNSKVKFEEKVQHIQIK